MLILVSPQLAPVSHLRTKHHYSSSAPDDFVLVPYDVRCDSPRPKANLKGKDGRFSPAER